MCCPWEARFRPSLKILVLVLLLACMFNIHVFSGTLLLNMLKNVCVVEVVGVPYGKLT